MALPLPSSLSPSKVSSFRSCALAFRFSSIDRLPEPPSEPAVKGTTVHRALELLMSRPSSERTEQTAQACLAEALEEMAEVPDYVDLELDDTGATRFGADASVMVERYFQLEDPRQIEPVGLEMMLEAEIGGVQVRGIIDRLERDEDGSLVVTDYKTGRAPQPNQERSRLGGVHFYAALCEATLGELPSKVQLIHLGRDPQVIIARPSAQSVRALQRSVSAIWTAVEKACDTEDFRPNKGPLCNWCSFQDFCPAFGGTPDDAVKVLGTRGPDERRPGPGDQVPIDLASPSTAPLSTAPLSTASASRPVPTPVIASAE